MSRMCKHLIFFTGGMKCPDNTNVCSADAQCTVGAFIKGVIQWKCACKPGYLGDGYNCQVGYPVCSVVDCGGEP